MTVADGDIVGNLHRNTTLEYSTYCALQVIFSGVLKGMVAIADRRTEEIIKKDNILGTYRVPVERK